MGATDSCLGYSLLSKYALMPLETACIFEKTVISRVYCTVVKGLLFAWPSVISAFGLVLACCANPAHCYLREWGKGDLYKRDCQVNTYSATQRTAGSSRPLGVMQRILCFPLQGYFRAWLGSASLGPWGIGRFSQALLMLHYF